MKTDKIYLVGFMGAGKSTVARALGASLGWQVEDIDDAIVARERQSIADIFARRGEAYFREIEHTVLCSLLPLRHAVVATGGGTFVEPENRRVINDDGASIWLDLSFEQVVARIPSDGRRPLATDRGTLLALYHARRAAYQLAHLRLDAGETPPGELVERIRDWLGY